MYLRRLSQTKLALGGEVTLAVVTDISDRDASRLFISLWKQVYMFERQFSRFLPKSELTIFNRTSGQKTPITPEFKALLVSAQSIGAETGGLYNPFIMPALQRTGYLKSAMLGYENDKQIDYTDRRIVGVDRLIIGDGWASIPYGTALDLGGCGKGYLADQLADILKSYQVQGYWLSLGGDIASFGRDESGNSLTIGVQDADNLAGTNNWIIDCPLENFAIATSGTFKRKSQNSVKDWHHIIDPATSQPAVTDIRLITVCADTAFKADVLASCAVILGSKKAVSFLKKHGIKSALLQCADKDGVAFEKAFGVYIRKEHSYNRKGDLVNA